MTPIRFSLVLCVAGFGCAQSDPPTSEATTVEAVTATCAATVDYNADPLNCGVCGNVCASGLCYWGVCADDRAGHIFVIGNSYRKSNPSWDRVLGNAVFLRESAKVNVVVYRGTTAADINTGTSNAISRAASILHRVVVKTGITNSAAVQTSLPTADVFVVEGQPQLDDTALGALADEWSLPLDDFTRGGGVVIVLDAPSAKNHGTQQVLGQLMSMTRAADVGTLGSVSAATDQAVGRVPLTFALADSVGYTSPSGFVDAATTDSGAAVVVHRSVD